METLNWRLLALVIALSFVLASAEPAPEPESEPASGSGDEQDDTTGNAATWMNGNIFAMLFSMALYMLSLWCVYCQGVIISYHESRKMYEVLDYDNKSIILNKYSINRNLYFIVILHKNIKMLNSIQIHKHFFYWCKMEFDSVNIAFLG